MSTKTYKYEFVERGEEYYRFLSGCRGKLKKYAQMVYAKVLSEKWDRTVIVYDATHHELKSHTSNLKCYFIPAYIRFFTYSREGEFIFEVILWFDFREDSLWFDRNNTSKDHAIRMKQAEIIIDADENVTADHVKFSQAHVTCAKTKKIRAALNESFTFEQATDFIEESLSQMNVNL